MDKTAANNPTANVFKGTIKHVVHNPPLTLVTVELDPTIRHEITVSFVSVTGAKASDAGTTTEAETLQPNVSAPPSPGDGVTVLVPVPNAVITRGI